MPNISSIFKEEMARISRKEMKEISERQKKAAAQFRSEITALRARVRELEKLLHKTSKAVAKSAPTVEVAEENGSPLRFSAKGFAAQRKKLGISAGSMAALLGVSALSVYKWEKGETRPRAKQIEAIAASRKLGKREVAARLEELAA